MIRKIFIIITLGILAACTLNEPKLPKWDTDWAIYLPTHDYNMAQAIEDEKFLEADTTDNQIPIIKISVKDTSDEIGIDEKDLGIKPEDRHASKTIDDIILNDPPEAFTSDEPISSFFDEIFPGFVFNPGDTLPPYDTISVRAIQHIVLVEDFNYIRMNSGLMYINFYHDIFMTIRPGMLIAVYDDSLPHYIGTFTFSDSIKSGENAESSHLDLKDKYMSNKLRLEYQIPLARSSVPVELDENKLGGTYRAGVILCDLKVCEANALIPAQTFSSHEAVGITEEEQEHRVISAKVKKGGATITFKNSLPLSANLQIIFLNMTVGNDTLQLDVPIEAGETSPSEYIDFSGAELANYKNPGSYIDSIYYRAQATVNATDGYVSIMGTDSFSVTVEMDSIFMESFTGELDTIDIDIEPVTQDDFDFFEEIEGNIRLEDLAMVIDFVNDINFEIGVDLTIAGYRRDPNTGIITVSDSINVKEIIKKSSIQPVTTVIIDKNYSSPSIVDLIAILPTEIRMYGDAKVYGEGSADITDKIQAFYTLESPLSFNITQPMRYEMATDTIEVDQDMRDMLSDDMHYASIGMDLQNGLPINAEIVLMLAVDSLLFDTTKVAEPNERIIISAEVSAGDIGTDGYVNSPAMSKIPIELTKENLHIFQRHPIYFKQWVNIPSTSGTIRFRQNDEIKVDAVIKTKITIDPEKE